MTVKEFFNSLDREKFIDYYCKYENFCGDECIDTIKHKAIIRDLLTKFETIEPKENTEGCIIFALPDPGLVSLNSFLIHKEDLFSGEEVEHYAYELCPMQEILGFYVSFACKYYLNDDYQFAASILYEMTFFGYSVDKQQEEVTEKKEELNKMVEKMEEGTAELLSVDEVFKDFNYVDPRTSYEQTFDNERYRIEGEFYFSVREVLYSLEKEYLKSF